VPSLPPKHEIGVDDAETESAGATATVIVPDPEQPLGSVTVAVYDVVIVGLAIGLLIPVLFNPAEGDQTNTFPVVAGVALSVTAPPGHMVSPTPTFTESTELTVTVATAEAVQPDNVPVTVYADVIAGEMEMELPVAPVDQT